MWGRRRRELDRQVGATAATHAHLVEIVKSMRGAIDRVEDASMVIQERANGGRSEGGSASPGPEGRAGEVES